MKTVSKMKTVTKALVAAVALVIGAQAEAAINSDAANAVFTGTGAGELFLSVVDRGGAAPRSYIRDLGITSGNFIANDASFLGTSIAADTNLQDILTNATGTIAWNLVAAYNLPDVSFNGVGYLSTSSQTLSVSNTPSGYPGLASAMGNIGIYLNSVNGVDVNYAANTSQIFGSAANAFYDTSWGDMWNGSHSTEGALNQALSFYYVNLADINLDLTGVQKMLGNWSLATNGALTYSAAGGAPVPVPAAVWLLGSALVGLVGVARRRNEHEAIEHAIA